jgi:hypothetical protein
MNRHSVDSRSIGTKVMTSSVICGAMLPHAPQFFTMPETEDRNTVERVKAAAEIGTRFSCRAGFAGDGPPAGELARSNGPADPLRRCRLRDLGSDHRPSQLLVSGSYSAYSLTHPIGPFSTPSTA